jgi:hypothetical protein
MMDELKGLKDQHVSDDETSSITSIPSQDTLRDRVRNAAVTLHDNTQLHTSQVEVNSNIPVKGQPSPMAATQPHVSGPLQSTKGVGDVGTTQHDVSRAVRVTVTNYDTGQTVYALWTNPDDVLQHQAPASTAALFIPCTDDAYQPAINAVPMNAAGLAKLTSMVYTNAARNQVRLYQRFRAATGHCFYPGMSLAQVGVV